MNRILSDRKYTGIILTLIAAVALATPSVIPSTGLAAGNETDSPACVINFIGHETSDDMTRVILHANTPIDYRGGFLHGDQVILNLANTEISLPTPVVEVGVPEVDRVIVGPAIKRDGESVLKVRLTGVHARSHKVEMRDNELFIDLTRLEGANDRKGLPKVIDNNTEVMAKNTAGPSEAAATWARSEPPKPGTEMEALPAGEATVTRMERLPVEVVAKKAAAPDPDEDEEDAPVVVAAAAPAPEPAPAVASAPAATLKPRNMLLSMAATTAGADSRSLTVASGRSVTFETGVPVTRVSVSNPNVAEPIAISPTQMLINGLAPGVTSMVLWPKEGAAIIYEVVVTLDTNRLSDQIARIFPNEKIGVQASKDSIVLSGSVSSASMSETLEKMASDYSAKVINRMVAPTSRRQVMLKVKFAEVSRSAMTELGSVLHHVDPTNVLGNDRGTSGTGEFSPPGGNLLNSPNGPDLTWSDAINLSFFEKSIDLGIFIKALKSRGLFQELAEPTLIAADGQEANFLAGGEFPVPIAQPGANFTAITIEWKKFGISLDFKPTIRDDETIVMKVKPEVSSLDFNNAVLVQGFRIPSVIVRRAETEVELKSGQAFAIAGLYDQNLAQTKSKIPVLGDIPLLGYLFRSKNLAKNKTELLVIVTPIIVEPLGSEAQAPRIEMPESFDLEKRSKKK